MESISLVTLGFFLVLAAAGVSLYIGNFLQKLGAPLPDDFMNIFYLALAINLLGYIMFVICILSFAPKA